MGMKSTMSSGRTANPRGRTAPLLLVSSAVSLSGCAPPNPPASPTPAQESAAMTVPDTPTDNPTLTAEEIGRRFLKLIEGLEARSALSLDRIKNETGIALGRFPVPRETLPYYANYPPLADG